MTSACGVDGRGFESHRARHLYVRAQFYLDSDRVELGPDPIESSHTVDGFAFIAGGHSFYAVTGRW